MNLDVVFVVNISEDIITWDSMAAMWEEIAMYVFFVDEDRLLSVEFFGYNDSAFSTLCIFSLYRLCCLLVIRLQERNVSTPTT